MWAACGRESLGRRRTGRVLDRQVVGHVSRSSRGALNRRNVGLREANGSHPLPPCDSSVFLGGPESLSLPVPGMRKNLRVPRVDRSGWLSNDAVIRSASLNDTIAASQTLRVAEGRTVQDREEDLRSGGRRASAVSVPAVSPSQEPYVRWLILTHATPVGSSIGLASTGYVPPRPTTVPGRGRSLPGAQGSWSCR